MSISINTAACRARHVAGISAILGALCCLSCSSIVLTKTGMITPNAYSERVGKDMMSADVDECNAYGSAERNRLLKELISGDPETVARAEEEARNEGKGEAVGEFLAPDGSSSAKKDVYGAVGAAAWDILFSEYDPDSADEDMLARYLGIEGGISGFSAEQRLRYACLRRKGYRVKDNEKDGSGIAYLERDPARVVLREEDGPEVVFYEYLPPSRRHKDSEPETDDDKS